MEKQIKNSLNILTKRLQEFLTFDFVQEMIDYSNLNMAQYLKFIDKIKDIFKKTLESYIFDWRESNSAEIELNELRVMLNYKDLRSVIGWCEKNNVFIISQGNRQIVNRSEFLLAYYSPFIKSLKVRHKNWKEIFVRYISGDIKNLLEDDETPVKKTTRRYRPKTEIEKSFLKRMKEL